MGARQRRVGIIGLGFGAQAYLPAFQSEGWEVAAVCARHREKVMRSETDDTFLFRLGFASGGTATMIASFAATPRRGARIAVLGDHGTLMADQPGPNPVDSGVVIGSRDGTALAPLPMSSRHTPFTDDRDPRLACFRLLVRDFSRGIDDATSPSPNFTDGWRCQQVMDAVRMSSREGRTIAIE